MRFLSFAALAVALALPAAGQTVPAIGAADAFDVAAWNVEHFGNPSLGPSDDDRQRRYVAAVIRQAEVDLWAIQEVGDADAWSALLADLQPDGYAGRLGESTGGSFELRLGFIYDPSVVQVIGTRHILSGSDFGGRRPFEMQARVTVDGEARTLRVIGIHAKAGTGADDHAERTRGAEALKAYIDDRAARGELVVLLGDFNDYLTRSISAGRASPYAALLADDAYGAATLDIDRERRPTFCGGGYNTSGSCSGGGSTRDHVVFTTGLLDAYRDVVEDRYLGIIGPLAPYTSTTSDHLPVVAQFAFPAVAADGGPEAGPVALLPAAPAPFRDGTRLRFRLDAPADVRLEVFDALGRRVASLAGAFGAGAHEVPLDGRGLAPGAYVVRLAADGEVRSRVVVRSR